MPYAQEELAERSVLLYGDEEGQGFVIFARDAVRHVVLLEVEQAACTKGKMTTPQGWAGWSVGAACALAASAAGRRARKPRKSRSVNKD